MIEKESYTENSIHRARSPLYKKKQQTLIKEYIDTSLLATRKFRKKDWYITSKHMDQSSQSSLSDVDDNIPLNEDEKDKDDYDEMEYILAPRDFDTTAMIKIRDKLLGVENKCELSSVLGSSC